MSDADKANYGYFGTTLFQEINDFKTFKWKFYLLVFAKFPGEGWGTQLLSLYIQLNIHMIRASLKRVLMLINQFASKTSKHTKLSIYFIIHNTGLQSLGYQELHYMW